MSALAVDPVLETARLILRVPSEEDFETVATFMTSDRTEYLGGVVTDRWQQWRSFLATFGHWALRGYGLFQVTLGDGTRVGRVGILNHGAGLWPEPELGWHLFDGHEGKGYASEAAMAVRDWAWRERSLGPLISQIHPDNTASRRLAERLGARVERETTLLGDPALIYRHPDPARSE